MIKAKKGLLIALFAAMMVFAFGATSVFADVTVTKAEWNDTFTSVKVTYSDATEVTYDQIVKTFSTTTGQVTADIDASKYQGMGDSPLSAGQKGVYYDLDNSEIAAGTIWTRALFEAQNPTDGVIDGTGLSITGNDAGITKPEEKEATMVFSDSDYAIAWKYAGFDADNVNAQTVTLTAVVKVKGQDADGALAKALVGSVPAKTITVQAAVQTNEDILIGFDAITKDTKSPYDAEHWTAPQVTYDGNEHTIVNSTVEGWTVAYALQDENGKYNAVDAVKVKDVDEYTIKVTYTNAEKKSTVTKVITAKVVPASDGFVFGFKNLLHNADKYAPVAVNADPWDYVKPYGLADADAATGLAYLKEKYSITETQSASDSTVFVWEIVRNKNYDAEAAAKTYKDLLANYKNTAAVSYNEIAYDYDEEGYWAYVVVTKTGEEVINDKTDLVEINYAPSKLTYKYKNKKKGLNKDYSFTVEAKAVTSKKAVTFDLKTSSKKISIDPATGMVTVAKGLKKGTYDITVIARTEDGAGYKAAQDTAKIRIVVKKVKK